MKEKQSSVLCWSWQSPTLRIPAMPAARRQQSSPLWCAASVVWSYSGTAQMPAKWTRKPQMPSRWYEHISLGSSRSDLELLSEKLSRISHFICPVTDQHYRDLQNWKTQNQKSTNKEQYWHTTRARAKEDVLSMSATPVSVSIRAFNIHYIYVIRFIGIQPSNWLWKPVQHGSITLPCSDLLLWPTAGQTLHCCGQTGAWTPLAPGASQSHCNF